MGSHFSGPARQRLGMQRREAASEAGQPLSVVREGIRGPAPLSHDARPLPTLGPRGASLCDHQENAIFSSQVVLHTRVGAQYDVYIAV